MAFDPGLLMAVVSILHVLARISHFAADGGDITGGYDPAIQWMHAIAADVRGKIPEWGD